MSGCGCRCAGGAGALLQQPDTELYGLETVKAGGLEPGTIYPILQRLRGAGWDFVAGSADLAANLTGLSRPS